MTEWSKDRQKKRLLDLLNEHHKALPPHRGGESAVLIPLLETPDGYDVLLEQRSLTLDVQPGDICLPGGGLEEDEKPVEAAVRETMEELLVGKDQIQLISALDGTFGPGDRIIWPFAGILRDYKDTWSKDEVDHTFRIPLSYFLDTDPERYRAVQTTVPEEGFPYELVTGGRRYSFRKREHIFLFYRHPEATIWGATAAIIYSFCCYWKWAGTH